MVQRLMTRGLDETSLKVMEMAAPVVTTAQLVVESSRSLQTSARPT